MLRDPIVTAIRILGGVNCAFGATRLMTLSGEVAKFRKGLGIHATAEGFVEMFGFAQLCLGVLMACGFELRMCLAISVLLQGLVVGATLPSVATGLTSSSPANEAATHLLRLACGWLVLHASAFVWLCSNRGWGLFEDRMDMWQHSSSDASSRRHHSSTSTSTNSDGSRQRRGAERLTRRRLLQHQEVLSRGRR